MSAPDPVTREDLLKTYRQWTTPMLETTRDDFRAVEAYHRKRREAIEIVLAERKASPF